MSLDATLASPSPSLARYAPPTVAGLGVAWNVFGVVQFLGTLNDTPASLMQMGMTPEQAAVYASYPAWMTIAFAIGVFGGLIGSALLLARRSAAVAVFAASLAGYLVLYVGDVTEGVFAALGAPQVAVLSTVVAIALALLVWAERLRARGALRGSSHPARARSAGLEEHPQAGASPAERRVVHQASRPN